MLKISKRERKKKHKYYMNVLKSEENPHSSISVLPDSKSGTLQTIQSKPGDQSKDKQDKTTIKTKSGESAVNITIDKLGLRKPTQMSALDRKL